MSLSNPKLKNPCKKFIEFKGDKGVFEYWDKDKSQSVLILMPLKLIVLDELSTITGFCDSTQSGVYSNEVHNITNQVLNVRTFKGGLNAVGKYADIKDKIVKMGGKFCKSVYAALIHDYGLELVNFRLKGISLSSWMDKKVDIHTHAVKVATCSDGKKGKVIYKIPNYESETISLEVRNQAIEMDKQLQAYLSHYKEQSMEESLDVVQEHTKDEVENEDIPF